MREIITTLYLAGGFLLVGSAALYVYTRLRLYPRNDRDLDNTYCEFEEEHPGYARYLKWSRISMAGACIGVMLVFVGTVI
jgi:hypothetical protein